jgi:hypothetical protein
VTELNLPEPQLPEGFENVDAGGEDAGEQEPGGGTEP